MSCPACQADTNQVKAGFNASGSQRFLCKECSRIYTPEPNCNGYPVNIRQRAKRLRKQGMSYRAIGRALAVSSQTVANWMKEKKQKGERDGRHLES